MGSPKADYSGRVYGKLTVLGPAPGGKGSGSRGKWVCRCECGNIREVWASDLRKERTSCGCVRKRNYAKRHRVNGMFKDYSHLEGRTFGKLTVLGPVPDDEKAGASKGLWICQCECGNIYIAFAIQLLSGRYKSCGCARRMPGKYACLQGRVFGELTVLSSVPDTRAGTSKGKWLCRCGCGKLHTVQAKYLLDGTTKTCGCHCNKWKDGRRPQKKRRDQRILLKYKEDLAGKKFGRLTVLGPVGGENSKGGRQKWVCLCECGKTVTPMARDLLRGYTMSCGCLHFSGKYTADLTGRVFGRLTVLGPEDGVNKGNCDQKWICRCECGRIARVAVRYLLTGKTRSCGCLKALSLCGVCKRSSQQSEREQEDLLLSMEQSNSTRIRLQDAQRALSAVETNTWQIQASVNGYEFVFATPGEAGMFAELPPEVITQACANKAQAGRYKWEYVLKEKREWGAG